MNDENNNKSKKHIEQLVNAAMKPKTRLKWARKLKRPIRIKKVEGNSHRKSQTRRNQRSSNVF